MKATVLASLSLGLLLGVAGWPTQAVAAPVFQDDFSQGFSKWETTRTRPELWKVVDEQAEAYITTRSTVIEMVPKTEYWNSHWQNIEYELDYTPLEGSDKNISFGFENLANWYEFHFVDSFYNLVRVLNGSTPFSINRPFTMINGQTYRVKIRFNSGLISIWINGELVGEEYDPTFNQNYGKIGIKAGTGAVAPTRVRFDNISVTELTEPTAPAQVTLFKQSDPLWAEQEYDSATRWSQNPTIRRWGCALTSMAMILRYHGLTQLPDGSDLTPATLNAWLKSQADGYLGEGALNWLAVTRLTKQLSDQQGTPALEYRAVSGSDLATAQQEISAQKPVVLQLPGHFVVGDTVLPADIGIKDPAYTFTQLSQHRTPILSTRTFQPSHTDLSYLLFLHDPELQLTITDESGQTVAQTRLTEQLRDPVTGRQTRSLTQTLVAQPRAGTYRIAVSAQRSQTYTLQAWVYDPAGQPTRLNHSGVTSQKGDKLELLVNYESAAPRQHRSQLRAVPSKKMPRFWWPHWYWAQYLKHRR